jgi:hypothetical protein
MRAGKRRYRAIVWIENDPQPGERVEILADDLDDALKLLELKYGQGNVFNLHNEEDANKPR